MLKRLLHRNKYGKIRDPKQPLKWPKLCRRIFLPMRVVGAPLWLGKKTRYVWETLGFSWCGGTIHTNLWRSQLASVLFGQGRVSVRTTQRWTRSPVRYDRSRKIVAPVTIRNGGGAPQGPAPPRQRPPASHEPHRCAVHEKKSLRKGIGQMVADPRANQGRPSFPLPKTAYL